MAIFLRNDISFGVLDANMVVANMAVVVVVAAVAATVVVVAAAVVAASICCLGGLGASNCAPQGSVHTCCTLPALAACMCSNSGRQWADFAHNVHTSGLFCPTLCAVFRFFEKTPAQSSSKTSHRHTIIPLGILDTPHEKPSPKKPLLLFFPIFAVFILPKFPKILLHLQIASFLFSSLPCISLSLPANFRLKTPSIFFFRGGV